MSKYESRLGIDQMLNGVTKVLISGMGGGGDVLTALHVRWALEKVAPHVHWIQAGVTGAPIAHFEGIELINACSGWVTERSRSSPPHRLIESVVAKQLQHKVFLLSCYYGVKRMIRSLNRLIEAEHIEMAIFIDGGTDSLAFKGCTIASPVEDTMALAALGLGDFSAPLKYRVAGVSVVGSDYEMSLTEISNQLLKIAKAGGYLGGTFFPVERLSAYSEIVSAALQVYTTATAQAPLLVTDTPFKRNQDHPIEPATNGFQLATFLFDAKIAAEVGNDYTHLILDLRDREAVQEALFTAMQNSSAEKR